MDWQISYTGKEILYTCIILYLLVFTHTYGMVRFANKTINIIQQCHIVLNGRA